MSENEDYYAQVYRKGLTALDDKSLAAMASCMTVKSSAANRETYICHWHNKVKSKVTQAATSLLILVLKNHTKHQA